MKQKKRKTTTNKEEVVMTKEDFLKALKKATRPVKPKPVPVTGKKKTSA